MKLPELKAAVWCRVGVANTKALKQQRPDLTQGRDLRYKAEWLAIYAQVQQDWTLADCAREEQELKQSLHRVARMAGRAVATVEETWQTLQHNAEADDLDITLADLEV